MFFLYIANHCQHVSIVFPQLVISATCSIVFSPVPRQRMRIPTIREVELYCDLQLKTFVPPVSYNFLLIVCCACCGFLTRKLPENYNESWYIFVSVSTTLFMWLVFLPTYFTTYYAMHQIVILASCLVLNASVTMVCFFLPKMYAVHFCSNKNMHIRPAGVSPTIAPQSFRTLGVPSTSTHHI